MMRPVRTIVRILSGLLLAFPALAQTQFKWGGGAGADDSWGTGANWTNGSAPAASYTGRIVFTNLDLGATNKLDGDRTVSGNSSDAAYGLVYRVNGPGGTTLPHVSDLNGFTLTLNGGALQVGLNGSNSLARIQNGTLKLGGANRTDLYVGYVNVDKAYSNAQLTITGTLNATNLGAVIVGRNAYGNTTYTTPQGILDLSGAAISRGATPNTLYLFGDLCVGWNSGNTPGPNPFGRVILPASLRQLGVQRLWLGYERDGSGTLDFGAGSVLTNLSIRHDFYLSSFSAQGRILNLPSNITIRVGTPGWNSIMIVSSFKWDSRPARWDIVGNLAITGGSFRADLAQLIVGQHDGGNQGTVTGRLDLGKTAVWFGGVPDQVSVPTLNIGSRNVVAMHYGGGRGNGHFCLPASVTNITAGTFAIGYCSNTRGWVDIGNPSALKTLLVTNGLLMGANARIGRTQGGEVVDYLPPGITVQVGLPSRYATLHVGIRPAGQYPYYGETYGSGRTLLRITNGTFRGYVSELKVGTKEQSTKVVTGIVDLARASVPVFEIKGHAYIGAEKGSNVYLSNAQSGNLNGKGYVYLPTCTVNVASNLFLGDTNSTSLGYLSLNGTRFRVGRLVEISPTGVITTRVNGASAGVEFLDTDTNKFAVAAAGRIKLDFTRDPPSPEQNCWGLKMAGNVTNLFRSLTNAPARLVWNTAGLSPALRPMVRIRYDVVGNYTYVGLPRVPRGSVFSWW